MKAAIKMHLFCRKYIDDSLYHTRHLCYKNISQQKYSQS